MEDAEIWLNNWENCVHNQHIYQNEFLTMMTAEGVRVTLRSTIELTTYLLSECRLDYWKYESRPFRSSLNPYIIDFNNN